MNVSKRRLSRYFAAIAVPLVLVAGGCTGGDDDGRPEECGQNDGDPRASSLECAESLFTRDLDAEETEELSTLSEEQRIKYARQLCDRAAEVTDGGASIRPLRSEFLDSAAAEWKLQPATLDAIALAAEPLCPDDFLVLDSLPVLKGQAEFDLNVEGAGAVTIEYTTSEGEVATEKALAPWTLRIALAAPIAVEVRVAPGEAVDAEGEGGTDAGPLRCTIRSGDKVLSEATVGEDRAPFSCSLSREQVIEASNSAPAAEVPIEEPEGPPVELPSDDDSQET